MPDQQDEGGGVGGGTATPTEKNEIGAVIAEAVRQLTADRESAVEKVKAMAERLAVMAGEAGFDAVVALGSPSGAYYTAWAGPRIFAIRGLVETAADSVRRACERSSTAMKLGAPAPVVEQPSAAPLSEEG